MAALFAATVVILGTEDAGELALGLTFCAMLVVVTLTDLERRVIPNSVLLVGAGRAIAIAAASDPASLTARLAAASARAACCCAWPSLIRAGWAWAT